VGDDAGTEAVQLVKLPRLSLPVSLVLSGCLPLLAAVSTSSADSTVGTTPFEGTQINFQFLRQLPGG